MEQKSKQQKQENVAIYFVYAAAAYFGLTFLLKGNKASAATLSPYKVADPPVIYKEPATQVYEPVAVPKAATKTKQSTPAKTPWIAESFPLRKGMKGASVKTLQQKLGVTADGAFGANTEAALVKQYGIPTVTKDKYQSILKPVSALSRLVDAVTTKPATADTTAILKSGSKGQDVYRLQKWLGFKDKKTAKKGEPVADSAFGKQTLAALQKKTGQSAISVGQLNSLTTQGGGIINWLTSGQSGMGYAGEIIVTKREATVLNNNLMPQHTVPKNTILGTRLMELTDPEQQKSYTQFQTIDGFRRWVDKDAV